MARYTDTFVDLELHGSGDQVVGFVEGFRQGVEYEGPLWFVGREQVDAQGFFERLRESLHRDTHVIAPQGFAEAIQAALEKVDAIDVAVASIRVVEEAELKFDYVCYATDLAPGVRRLIEEDLPEGVSLRDYSTDESKQEDAKGIELYGPVHDYELTGRGRYVGAVDGIIEMARRLKDQDFIHSGRIELHHAS